MLLVEKSAERLGVFRARLGEIEIARIDRIRMERDQKRGIAPEGTGAAHAFAPKREAYFWRYLEKLLRKASFGVEQRLIFPGEPADVVLLRGEANLVVRHRRSEVLIAPG